ncbi:hypothetical protein FA95DRAFT_1567284 [Auriscalpium vulgare]|uniref:Uncharacterized protein n=1 Tax=Auriscalpium vulgare TaxID=40419 RepID=A0ACB8R524_9AGAM|nr:hypothetical protein FA95DRAFT_1567284 [Auriscalpium vulgare]
MSGKIIIPGRPRRGRPPAAASAGPSRRPPTPEPPTPMDEEQVDTPAASSQQDDADGAPDDDDESAGDANDGETDEPADVPEAVPVPRPRGRPRGRGRGALVGSERGARARGRGRGLGRGRGRGRGTKSAITIRLPGRVGDETHTEAEDAPAGAVADEETPGVEEAAGEVLGGGKPFRMVQGKAYVVEGDEYVTEEDPKGDSKIDKWGNLLGDRKFKAGTFALPNRHPERMYMLAIDAARTSGFRDSLYYFRRNHLALKLNATQQEKEYLIEIGKLGSHLRTRSVTLITARSAFKLHGSKMLLDGRWVIDDYYEDKVLAEITEKGLKPGDLVGDLSEPQTTAAAESAAAAAAAAQKADRGGGQGMYRAGGPTTLFGGAGWGPYSDGPLNAVRKSLLNRDGLNEENWMLIAAQRTAEAAEEFAQQRRQALKPYGGIYGELSLPAVEEAGADVDAEEEGRKRKKARTEEDVAPMGVYEPHSGLVFYRADTQPTKSRWEGLPDTPEKRQVLGGAKTGNGAWALAWVDTIMEFKGEGGDAAAQERDSLLSSISS